MYQSEVRFHSVEQIHTFVNAVNRCHSVVFFRTDRGAVNAKSILGVMSMDFSKPLCLQYDSEEQNLQRVIGRFQA